MKDYYERKIKVTNAINSYNELRGMCIRFFAGFSEAIQNNEFYASAKTIEETRIEVYAIGAKVDMYFDYVITNGNVFGIIKCDEILSKDQRVNIVTNYFDWDGRTYLDPKDGNPMQGLTNRYYPGTLIFQICEALLARHFEHDVEGN